MLNLLNFSNPAAMLAIRQRKCHSAGTQDDVESLLSAAHSGGSFPPHCGVGQWYAR
jgi:hypothetical protein